MRGRLRRFLGRRRLRDPELAFLFEPPSDQRVICLDTETTGLDPRRDQLLSIAALPIEGDRVRTSEALRLTVRPDHGAPTAATIPVHGLRPRDVADGMPPTEAVEQLLRFVGPRPLVGYYLAFDLAVLARVARPRLGGPLPNPRLD